MLTFENENNRTALAVIFILCIFVLSLVTICFEYKSKKVDILEEKYREIKLSLDKNCYDVGPECKKQIELETAYINLVTLLKAYE